MRTLGICLFLFLFFIISIPLYLVETIIGKFSPYRKVTSSQAIVVWALNCMLFISGTKKTIIGLENVPKDQAVLYAANHRSYFDIIVGYTSVPNLTGFVAKKEMKKVPFISVWMKYLNCLFLDRDNIKEGLKMVLEGIELIKKGYSLWIAPEGTRNTEKELLTFKEGSLKIAEKSGCPIIPVTLNNTDAQFERQFPWVKKAHIIIEFGKPIYPNELEKEQRKFLGSHVQSIIQNTYNKNQSLI
jgi:1-acyl-sn-glycerol-3-phosphate acyltransferase